MNIQPLYLIPTQNFDPLAYNGYASDDSEKSKTTNSSSSPKNLEHLSDMEDTDSASTDTEPDSIDLPTVILQTPTKHHTPKKHCFSSIEIDSPVNSSDTDSDPINDIQLSLVQDAESPDKTPKRQKVQTVASETLGTPPAPKVFSCPSGPLKKSQRRSRGLDQEKIDRSTSIPKISSETVNGETSKHFVLNGTSFPIHHLGSGEFHDVFAFDVEAPFVQAITINEQTLPLNELIIKMIKTDSEHLQPNRISKWAVESYQKLKNVSEVSHLFRVPQCYMIPDIHTGDDLKTGHFWIQEKIEGEINAESWSFDTLSEEIKTGDQFIKTLPEIDQVKLHFAKIVLTEMAISAAFAENPGKVKGKDIFFNVDDFKPDNVRFKIVVDPETGEKTIHFYITDFSNEHEEDELPLMLAKYAALWSGKIGGKSNELVFNWLTEYFPESIKALMSEYELHTNNAIEVNLNF